MAKFQSLFKKFDLFIFTQIEHLVASTLWQQVADRFRLLTEGQQKVTNHILVVLLSIVPVSIVIILFAMNVSLRSSVNMQKDLISSIGNINSKKGEVTMLERSRLSKTTLNSRSDANRMVSNLLSRRQIDTKKVTVKSFSKKDSSSGAITVSRIELSFKDFSTTNLTEFFSSILKSEKGEIPTLSVEKNSKDNTLKGKLSIIHYGKAL